MESNTGKDFSSQYLIEHNKKFKLLVENMGQGLIFIDNNDMIRYVNKKFCQIVGYDAEELVDKDMGVLLFDGKDRELLLEKKKLRFRGISDSYIIKNRTKSGKKIWVEVNGTAIEDDDGNVIGTIGIVSDKTKDIDLKNQEKKRQEILEAVSICMEKFLTMENFNTSVNEVLEILGNVVGVDRVCVYENFEKDGVLYTSQIMGYVSEGSNPHLNHQEYMNIPYLQSGLKRWIDLLGKNEPIYGNVTKFPTPERKILELFKLNSIVIIPIFLSGKWWGFLGFEEFKAGRIWTESEITALRKAANGIGIALENWLAKKFLKKSEEDFRHLFLYAPTGMVVRSIDGVLLRVNQAFCDMLGFTRQELIGKHYREITHPDDVDKEVETAELLLSSGLPYAQIEKRYLGKEGKIIYSLLQISLQRDSKGIPTHCIAHVTDISERKFIEQERVNIERIYRTIFENANDAIFIEDEDENIIDVNAHATGLTGYSREELLKMRTVELQPEEYESYEMRHDDRFDTQIVHKDGRILDVELTISQIKQGDNVLLISIVRDMTDKKRAEEQMKLAKERAEESDRVKSHFLAQMSHEIRTPINAILGYSQLIREELEDKIDDELKSNFDIIESASQRLMRTIDLILRMSEIQTGNYKYIPKTIDIYSQVLQQLYKQFKISADNKNLTFKLVNKADDTTVTGDEFSIMQIFSNLIGNALKYTIEGKVEVEVGRNGKGVCVKVTDTGIGISKEYIPHLFQLFSQEEQGYTRKFEGNGLGLALVKKYCEMNNAEIEVQSEKHKGSTFTVYFPE